MRWWLPAAVFAASSTAVLGAPAPTAKVPVVVAPPPLVAKPAKPAIPPSQAEAMAFVQAYSPSDLRRKAELLVLEKNFLKGLKSSPGIAPLLDAFPALGPELQKAMEGQIDVYIVEYNERFYPLAAAIVLNSLSKDDVQRLTAFYTSALGRRALELAIENVDGSEIMERAAKDQAIDNGVTTRQAMRTGILTYAKLSETERAGIRDLMLSPAGRHFSAIVPQLTTLQTELMNDPGPRFRASADQAMAEAFQRVTGIDPNSK